MKSRVLVALAATAILTACGGGGGGGSSSNGGPSVTVPTVSGARSVDPGRVTAGAARAATNLPNFGSVTQSSSGVSQTTDAASARFDERNIAITVRRESGAPIQLNSATDAVPGYTSDVASVIPGHRAREWGLLDYSNTTVTAAYAITSWANTDPTDYLAGGYWMHLEGDFSAGRLTGAHVGAFVDGPELGCPDTGDCVPISLPVSGTATFSGTAAGLYAYRYGSNHAQVPTGTHEIGEFATDARLTASFSSNTISGCLGCGGTTLVTGVAVAPDGRSAEFEDVQSPVRVRLGATSFDRQGEFSSRNVSVEFAGRTVSSSTGAWGGQFSNRPAANGGPRLAAGTAGARWNENDGSQGVFVGAYAATKQ